MNKNKERGFTRLEVILLTVITVVAFAMVVPKFCTLGEEAKMAAEKQDVSRIRIAITNYYLESMIKNRTPAYPDTLDSAKIGDASMENPLFTKIFSNKGVISEKWRKLGSTTYECYRRNIYTYDPFTGSFN